MRKVNFIFFLLVIFLISCGSDDNNEDFKDFVDHEIKTDTKEDVYSANDNVDWSQEVLDVTEGSFGDAEVYDNDEWDNYDENDIGCNGDWELKEDESGEEVEVVEGDVSTDVSPQGCTDGEKKCFPVEDSDVSLIKVCKNSEFVLDSYCYFDCQDGNCMICEQDTAKCYGDLIFSCADGVYEQVMDCHKDGICTGEGSDVSCDFCTEGDKRCNGNDLEVCQGQTWVKDTSCEALGKVCSKKECVDGIGLEGVWYGYLFLQDVTGDEIQCKKYNSGAVIQDPVYLDFSLLDSGDYQAYPDPDLTSENTPPVVLDNVTVDETGFVTGDGAFEISDQTFGNCVVTIYWTFIGMLKDGKTKIEGTFIATFDTNDDSDCEEVMNNPASTLPMDQKGCSVYAKATLYKY